MRALKKPEVPLNLEIGHSFYKIFAWSKLWIHIIDSYWNS